MAVIPYSTFDRAQGDRNDLFASGQFQTYNHYVKVETAKVRATDWKWANYLGKGGSWDINQGPIKRTVRVQMGPFGSQFATGEALLATQEPSIDEHSPGESQREVKLYWKDFESPDLSWRDDYFSFIKVIEPHRQNLERQMARWHDMYLRQRVLYYSPFVYVCGAGLVQTTPADDAQYKTVGWWKDRAAECTEALTLSNLMDAFNKARNVVGMKPHSGPEFGTKDKGWQGKYTLLTDVDTQLAWIQDPWIQQMKSLKDDLLNNTFSAPIFGLIHTEFEDLPLRLAKTATTSAASFTDLFLAPEVASAAGNFDAGEPIPNTNFALVEESPWQVSYLLGNSKWGYRTLNAAPPPGQWAPGAKMNWNGKVELIKPTVITTVDSNGNIITRGNDRNRLVRLQATMLANLEAVCERTIIPIIHKRREGVPVVI